MAHITPEIASQRYKEKYAEIQAKQKEENDKLAKQIEQKAQAALIKVLEDIDKLTKEQCVNQYVIFDGQYECDLLALCTLLESLGWTVAVMENYEDTVLHISW